MHRLELWLSDKLVIEIDAALDHLNDPDATRETFSRFALGYALYVMKYTAQLPSPDRDLDWLL